MRSPWSLTSSVKHLGYRSGSRQTYEPINGHHIHVKDGGAHPQMLGEEMIWPERWGITRAQCKELWTELRESHEIPELLDMEEKGKWKSNYTVYQLVEKIIKKRTAGTGTGYALCLNHEKPKEVNTMVSHAWSEEAIEFLEAICRSTDDNDILFICALSLYQNGDDKGPSIAQQLGTSADESPFKKVLQHIHDKGTGRPGTCSDDTSNLPWYEMSWREFWYRYRATIELASNFVLLLALCVFYVPPVFDGVVYTLNLEAVKTKFCKDLKNYPSCHGTPHYVWIWQTLWPAFVACWPLSLFFFLVWLTLWILLHRCPMYRGRMIVVPNRGSFLYDRLWCVYEIFVARKLGVACVLANTMASCGANSSRFAECASPEDEARIKKEIKEIGDDDDPEGFGSIDDSIETLGLELERGVVRMVAIWAFPICILGVAYYNMYDPNDCRMEFWGDTIGLLLSILGLVFTYYKLFKAGQGVCPANYLKILMLIQLLICAIFEIVRRIALPHKASCLVTSANLPHIPLMWSWLFGFAKATRMTWGLATAFSLIGLLFTRFTNNIRSFEKKWSQLLALAIFCVCWILARATIIGKKKLSKESWRDPTQALPELFDLATEFFAVFGCPINGIWGAALYWGLQVDWDDPWGEYSEKRLHEVYLGCNLLRYKQEDEESLVTSDSYLYE